MKRRLLSMLIPLRDSLLALLVAGGLTGDVALANLGTELRTLNAANAGAGDLFGSTNSVALSGNMALVGAPNHRNPDTSIGAAFIFDASTGQELFKLAADGRQLGASVALSGNRALVGATSDNAGMVQGAGAAHLFDATTGQHLSKLTADDAAVGDNFGHAVAVSSQTALVGAPRDNHDAGSFAGATYVYNINNAQNPVQTHKLIADDAAAGDEFGSTVALRDSLAVVGAPDSSPGGMAFAGSAYLFNTANGQQLGKLTASDAGVFHNLGRSVAIDGNYALVGASGANAGNTSNAGAAYLFDVANPASPTELHKLTALDAASEDLFGWSVAIRGNTAIVGAYLDDLGGNESAGSAYFFDVTTGQQLLKLIASDGAPDDWFGRAVALSDSLALVGSPRHDDHGSAYVLSAERGPGDLFIGDFNADGIVDSADYTSWRDGLGIWYGAGHFVLWQSNFGATPPVSHGDFNNDGTVDAADYTTWRDGLGTQFSPADFNTWKNNFGATPGSGLATAAPVPEPASSTVWLLAILAVVRRRSARR